tara:strand:- start:394 stop:939 length:546 start_codon:yes stop_codon:yes gene_type:complete
MNSKKLIKVIKTIVEAEVAKKQETFLRKTFPKILEEEVNKRLGEVKKSESSSVDPFSLAEAVLEKDREVTQVEEKKVFTKNPILNEVLNQTANQPQTNPMDKTLTFGTHNVQSAQGQPPVGVSGVESFRQEMASKMGMGHVQSKPQKTGLGVQTGLPGLDKILNRDNSQLVKAMMGKKVES